MTSIYSPLLRLTYQGTGDNNNTWGDVADNGAFQLMEDAIAGMASIVTTGGTVTLTTVNGATDQARKMILNVSGALVSNATIVAPSLTKVYVVSNMTTGAFTLTVKTLAGTGVAVVQNANTIVWCDAVNVLSAASSGSSGSLVGYQVFTASGTYTKAASANAIFVELIGGGGAGGGAPAGGSSTTTCAVGSGGGAGAYSAKRIASPSATYPVSIGAGGMGVNDATGGTGGDTFFGTSALVFAKGGVGGQHMAIGSFITVAPGGIGGSATFGVGDLRISGAYGDLSYRISGTQGFSGEGAQSYYGTGGSTGFVQASGGTGAGTAADVTHYGAGGAGSASFNSSPLSSGGAGAGGVCIVWEFV